MAALSATVSRRLVLRAGAAIAAAAAHRASHWRRTSLT